MIESRDLNDAELFNSLDWNRSVIVRKVDGLTLEQATAVVMPTGVTLLGVVRHLAWVERGWFQHHLLGAPLDSINIDIDIDASFRIDSVASVAQVIDDYVEATEASRAIAAQHPLARLSIIPHDFFGIVTLRWMLLHMIRETARHAGHMDILRELTDGQTGF